MARRSAMECTDTRNCFAKQANLRGNAVMCTLLTATYDDNTCPFCKQTRDVTKGIKYPYMKNYGGQ